jgi:hypothetical protein
MEEMRSSRIKHGMVADPFRQYLDKASGQADSPSLLDNVLPWVKSNSVARYILKHFEQSGEEP